MGATISRRSRGHLDQEWEETRRRLLPLHVDDPTTALESAIPPAAEVTKVALRLRRLVEACVPCELELEQVTRPHSRVITDKVIRAAREAGNFCPVGGDSCGDTGNGNEDSDGNGDGDYSACVVFCLLVNKRWWQHQARIELWDAGLHQVRAVACEVIAKHIIEEEQDVSYLLHSVLLKRYSILVNGEPTLPSNAVEKAVDLHALRVIGSSGYQKCIAYLWKGWLVQDEDNPAIFVDYKDKDNTSFLAHLDPDRMRAPVFQNSTQMLISFIYLGLYTAAINSINPGGDIDPVEGLLYTFTCGFIFDEITKFWKAGYYILGFWNAFNFVLYSLLTVSLVLRLIALGHGHPDGGDSGGDNDLRYHFSKLSYNFLAVSAPMFWIRLLLYLDSFRFFGAMLVVLKVMMKESIIFFSLLVVIVIGFLQAFIGLDYIDDQEAGDATFIVQSMANAIMQSPDFSGFEKFQHPFGLLLYYSFTFIVTVILLNILVALYNSAYQDIYDNANDEFLALFAQKTMLFVRAPDENVFIAPFNLVELFCVSLPFQWWLSRSAYKRLNDAVMLVIYFPILLVAGWVETRIAAEIRANRARGDADDDTVEEWEQMDGQFDFAADGWDDTVRAARSNLEDEVAVVEVRKLGAEVERLRDLLERVATRVDEKI